MIPTLDKLANTEISFIGMAEPAKAGAVKGAVDPVIEQAGKQLPSDANLGAAILSAEQPPYYALRSDEARLLPSPACTRKKIEFELGRAAAHLAMQRIGHQHSVRVLRGEGGEPLWPDGIVGSITHCYPWSVAVAAHAANLAIGIDLESVKRIHGPDISYLICRNSELAWVQSGNGNFHERLAMIFSAKEALYKALYPLCRRYIDFMEVELSWLPPGYFHALLLTHCGLDFPAGQLVRIQCHRSADLVFS